MKPRIIAAIKEIPGEFLHIFHLFNLSSTILLLGLGSLISVEETAQKLQALVVMLCVITLFLLVAESAIDLIATLVMGISRALRPKLPTVENQEVSSS